MSLNSGEENDADEDAIDTDNFEELCLDAVFVDHLTKSWKLINDVAGSREALGDMIYKAVYEGVPTLQPHFVAPRAIQAMKFESAFNNIVMSLGDPPALKTLVETLGFNHLTYDLSLARVGMVRSAIIDLFHAELADGLTETAQAAWTQLLSWIGGAFIFIKTNYAFRLNILLESWKQCNVEERRESGDDPAFKGKDAGDESPRCKKKEKKAKKQKQKEAEFVKSSSSTSTGSNSMAQNVPTTYKEMFEFNAAVMGFGNSLWMQEVLACFDSIVLNVMNSTRLQEECDVLVLRISRIANKVNLSEYKSCMLATLRSLLPKNWTTQHEVAWSWLWENVERLLVKTMGSPPVWEKALANFLNQLDDTVAYDLRALVYAKFFAAAPAGQDYFKQSNTLLHLIFSKVMEMTLHFYQEPVKTADKISAIGLRHVGYGIPTELFAPFVDSAIGATSAYTEDKVALESFRWSLGLIAKSLVRTITEGSTIVMKAINANSAKMTRKALACAPRGERADWMLIVQVGTQSISPLRWSLETGALEAASAMLSDLLTIRADRDKYYYGAHELFYRHPDIVKMLIEHAPSLLPELLDGLVWRSRTMQHGMRRVNYYIKYLLVHDGKFAKTFQWLVAANDPMIVCHPLLTFLADLTWKRVASSAFLLSKCWFLFTLTIFIITQDVLAHSMDTPDHPPWHRYLLFGLRCFTYSCSLGAMVFQHTCKTLKHLRSGDMIRVGPIAIPGYWRNAQDAVSLGLLISLLAMLSFEPILYCFSDPTNTLLFNPVCANSEGIHFFPYSFFSMFGMWAYILMLMDLAVFNNRISSFMLICTTMLPEVGMWLCAMLCSILAISSALCNLEQHLGEFQVLWSSSQALYEMVVGVYDTEKFEEVDLSKFTEQVVLGGCWGVFLFSQIFLAGVLVAQLACSYQANYNNMVGHARLRRMNIIVKSMPMVSESSLKRFFSSLHLSQRLEFNEGDVGVTGGVQILEPANRHPCTTDTIRRYGGATASSMQWPEDQEDEGEEDKFEHFEKVVMKALGKLANTVSKKGLRSSAKQSTMDSTMSSP